MLFRQYFLVCFCFIWNCSPRLTEKYFQRAEDYVRSMQYQRAIEEYSKVINFDPKSSLAVNAQLRSARVFEFHLKDYPAAIRSYREVYRKSSEKRTRFEARLAIARIYDARLENPAYALEEYEGILGEFGSEYKEAAEVALSSARALMSLGRYRESAQRYARFRELFPGSEEAPRALLEEGQALLADGRARESIEIFRRAIHIFSGQTAHRSIVGEAYYGLGSALESEEKYEAALEAYRESLSLYPNPRVVESKIIRLEQRKKAKRIGVRSAF